MDRREFLVGNFGAALLASLPADAFAQRSNPPASATWDPGQVRHLLPTVSDSRVLIKASFTRPLPAAPTLRIGPSAVRGRMTDTAGECWQFNAGGLAPGRRHALSLAGANGRPLCEPWNLSTFPTPDVKPDRFRVLFFTCAGGPENTGPEGNLPTAIRNRLLRRALSFQPHAAVANGDHVYWDLHSPRVPRGRRDTTKLDSFNRSALARHASLRPAGRDPLVRCPPHHDARWPQRCVHRATGRAVAASADVVSRHDASGSRAIESARLDRRQVGRMVPGRPRRRWQAHDCHTETVLAGRLVEAARSTDRFHGREEGARSTGRQRRSARDWNRRNQAFGSDRSRGEPGHLGAVRADRDSAGRLALGVSRCRRDAAGAPGHARRGQAVEQHGFTLADFLPDRIVLRLFKWDLKTQSLEAIDSLEPFHTTELGK